MTPTSTRIVTVPNIDRAWFTNKLAALDMSQRELARRLNINSAAIVLSLQGKRNFSSSEITEIARLFNEPISEVMTRLGIDTSRTERNKYSDGAILADGTIDRKARIKLRPMPSDALPAMVYQTLRTHAQEVHNWQLHYEPSNRVMPEAIGALCVVAMLDGPEMMRLVSRGSKPGLFNLRNMFTGEDTHDVPLVSASPVKAIIPL